LFHQTKYKLQHIKETEAPKNTRHVLATYFWTSTTIS